MPTSERIEDFYLQKFNQLPEFVDKKNGHFNVFSLKPFVGEFANPLPYRKRDYYKVTLMKGSGNVHYADRTASVERYAIVFTNPNIPYKWENTDKVQDGYFCIFSGMFFNQFGNINEYTVFQPSGVHIFELDEEQYLLLEKHFLRMLEEIQTDYQFKFDVLRTIMYEILHYVMRSHPALIFEKTKANSNQRIYNLFLELLERQFPIDNIYQKVQVKAPSEFAEQLNIHVNHLNRVVKESSERTTSELIAERFLKESQQLLKQSNWNIAQISDALGFHEVTNFNSFFKKHTGTTPSKYRSGKVA